MLCTMPGRDAFNPPTAAEIRRYHQLSNTAKYARLTIAASKAAPVEHKTTIAQTAVKAAPSPLPYEQQLADTEDKTK